jgi:phosphoglycerate dehydrogenase-like enzyme
MKPTAVFINIGRGESVIEDDLIIALSEKIIGGASLDVTRIEPLPKESPLWD